MTKPYLRATIAATLAACSWLITTLPAGAHHTGFDKGEYEAREDAAFVDLVVGSAPCCPGPSGLVDYHTSNLGAIAGEDYQQTSGTLTFPACSLGCTIRVPIKNDDAYEGAEQFEVRLTNFRGVFVPDRTRAVVTIIDDDPAPATSAPSISRSNTSRESGGTPSSGSRRASLPEPIKSSNEPSQMNSGASESTEGKEQVPLSSSKKAPGFRSPEPQNPPLPKFISTAAGILLALAAGALLIVRNARLKRSADE